VSAARARHVPLRRCAVCRHSLPQSELIRFARDESGSWRIDRERRAGGRGMWVCRQERCHQQKALGRAFRAQAADVAGQLAGHGGGEPKQERENASKDGGTDV
jgi:predicted RNA-binding protein YlxR (DUF448 family)